MSLVQHMTVLVDQNGARETEVAVNSAIKSTERAAKAANETSAAYQGFARSAGDASEAMDKKLEDSIGRVFKGTDRLASIVGQVATAFGLVTLAVGAAKAAYDRYTEKLARQAELNSQHATLAAQVEVLQRQAAALGTVRPLVEDFGRAHKDATPALAEFAETLRKDIAALEAQAAATDAARAQVAAFYRTIAESEFDIDLEQRTRLIKAKLEFERAAAELAIRERQAAEERARVGPDIAGFAQGTETARRAEAVAEDARAAFDMARGIYDEELHQAKVQAGRVEEVRAGTAKAIADPFAGFEDAGPDEGMVEFLENQERAAYEAQARARRLALESLARDQDRRLELMEDSYDRELAALDLRHSREREMARQLGDDLSVLDAVHQNRRTALAEKHAEARAAAQLAETKATIGAVSDVAGAVGEAASHFEGARAIEMTAQGIQDAAQAASYTADSIAAFARYDYAAGIGYAAAAAAKTVSAAMMFRGAAQVGEGGGGASAGAAGGGGGGGGRTELGRRTEEPDRERSITINANFSGQPLITRPDVEDAVVRALNGAQRRRGGARVRP